MDITEVRIKLMEIEQEERLLGFCSITFDQAFVIRDLKIIRGSKGFFVAMPSRKLMDRCPSCSGKNQLRASFCNFCGEQLNDNRSFKQPNGKAKLYSDIAHPINSECRDLIQEKVLKAYEQELKLYEQPGYVCRYDDFGENDIPQSESSISHSLENTSKASLNSQQGQNLRLDSAESEKKLHNKSDSKSTPTQEVSDDFGAGLF